MSNLPIPSRVWSRVQSQCTYVIPNNTYSNIYVPLINKTVSPAEAEYRDKLLYKGNILQYKCNSSKLTKNQIYSKISNGLWSNRTKVFATQSQTYSNPNTTGLLRVNSIEYPFPNQLPGKPNNISGPFQYNVPNPFNCPGDTLQDSGNLVCGSYANPCTGEIIQTLSKKPLCFPNTCSDVPGKPQPLCWDPKLQTWFPRQRYFMNNSTNKWPEGYKGFVSAVKPFAPVLSGNNYTTTTVQLSWTNTNTSNNCVPLTSYKIYQNGILINSVSYTILNITVAGLDSFKINNFYIVAVSNNIQSSPSNVITFPE